ncbi:exonuclease SbcCD subunit D [Idiomarina seosinensis]|uniref:exonuclease SbcCD subunit D n=1 Tax=Idiomarina seosinensis TaxID=281739 RepID=UPI003851189B
MKLLHTSDWHLGRIFNQRSLLEDQAYVLDQIIAYAKDYAVDAVVVAGDIYDRALPAADAVNLLNKTLNTLIEDVKVPVIMISGNHDGADRLGFAANLLKTSGLHLFTSFEQLFKPVQLATNAGELVLWGIPYCDPEQVRDFFGVKVSDHQSAQEYVTGQLKKHMHEHYSEECCHVVISHSFIDGGSESDSERPLSIGGADRVSADLFRDFAYTALGHLHQAQYKGQQNIRYSGSPLKYSFSEVTQKKSVTLVSFDTEQNVSHQLLPLSPLRDVRVLEGNFDQLLAAAVDDPNSDDYLQIKLTDQQAILDPLARLRTVYPNVLDLTKLSTQRQSSEAVRSREQLAREPLDIIDDFYQDVIGDGLSAEQRSLLNDVLQDLNRNQQDS